MRDAHLLKDIKPADLPAPPQAALEMLRACSDEQVDQKVLARFAESDPVLTAEVLRVVNTPLFGLGREVSSVKHAIALLGTRALRSIILCLMVREAVQGHLINGFNITAYWEDTLRRATCARELARFVQQDIDECFTLGMMQDFGTLLLFYLQPELATEYSTLRQLDPITGYAREQEIFATTHTQAFTVLAQAWSLPQNLIEAVSQHHQPESNLLANLLCCCDWVNAVFTNVDVNTTFEYAQQLLQDKMNMSAQEIQSFFDGLPDSVEQSAQALGLHIPNQVNFEDLLRRANLRLAKDNSSYQQLTWQLEKAIAERDQLAKELNDEIALAREIQRKLMPEQSQQKLPVYGINKPARNVSGDFYDYLQHKDGNIWFIMGDVSGKGINAGMLMAKTTSLFHCLAKHMTDPARLVKIINEELCETSTRGYFVTAVIGLYAPQTKSVQLINAGHLPVIIIGDDGKPMFIPADTPPLGILPNSIYRISDPIVLQNKSLYLYSDGLTECMTAENHLLEVDGLVRLIQEHADKPTAQRLDAIVDAILPGSQLHDDITLLILQPE